MNPGSVRPTNTVLGFPLLGESVAVGGCDEISASLWDNGVEDTAVAKVSHRTERSILAVCEYSVLWVEVGEPDN